MKSINTMTRREIGAIPYRKKWDEEILCDSLVILPARFDLFSAILWKAKKFVSSFFGLEAPPIYQIKHLHDSGYRLMDFVAVKRGMPICRLSGCSDVIHMEGISGFGENWVAKYGKVPEFISPTSWNIDCLNKSGLLNLWCRGQIKCGPSLSSFEIYQIKGGINP